MHNDGGCWDYDLEIMCPHAVDRSQGGLVEIDLWYFGTDNLPQLHRREGFVEAVVKLPLLEHLEVSYCSLSEESLKFSSQSCPNLKTLKLNCEPMFSYGDDEALVIAETMPELHHLQLIGNGLTNKALNAILDACLHLDLRKCFRVDFDGTIKELKQPCDSTGDSPFDDFESIEEEEEEDYSDNSDESMMLTTFLTGMTRVMTKQGYNESKACSRVNQCFVSLLPAKLGFFVQAITHDLRSSLMQGDGTASIKICGYVYSKFAFVIPFLFTVTEEQFHLTSICDSDNDCSCINQHRCRSSHDRNGRRIYETWSGHVLMFYFNFNCIVDCSQSFTMVPETLPEEALSKMSTPPKSESPIITPNELTEADGFVFGFPTRYGMMAAQFKVFLDATGGLRRTQSLAGKPAGSSTALALKVVAKKPLHQSAHVYIICDGGNIEGFATKVTEPQPKYSTTEKQLFDMLISIEKCTYAQYG
ncbi:unnamed protein product [Eruca vesicaria subsp. sativa]|uniref:NAD(P)H dehydrogenase (quinone) n=1 Tax=Eruca vesicaria subsp. sativa TaxID=29727 RepID=A0ABC8LBI1_ERUVS|nr:unnamed protein product [Eruca vesicaria subsp. sativa]